MRWPRNTRWGSPFRLESYQSLGDLRLTFEHEGTPTDYRFELDIDSAIARLSYRLGGVRYTREVFASHPAQAIVMRLSADAPGRSPSRRGSIVRRTRRQRSPGTIG